MVLPKHGVALVVDSPDGVSRNVAMVQVDRVLKECFWEQSAIDLFGKHFFGSLPI
jgi:hypothetical protein